jgi:hypothetical protein
MGIIVPEEGKRLTDTIIEKHTERVLACQGLFFEALRRYTEDRTKGKNQWNDSQIVTAALKTLVMNGFSRAEVMDALA